MLWVVRAGKKAMYIDEIINNKKIYIPWDGYKISLEPLKTREEYRALVQMEKNTENRISISNWSGQLYSFVKEMNVGDFVLVPMYKSREYILAKITGEYSYCNEGELNHSRDIEILERNIPSEIFEQSIRYSLGTFRTIFKIRQEEEILQEIETWERKS